MKKTLVALALAFFTQAVHANEAVEDTSAQGFIQYSKNDIQFRDHANNIQGTNNTAIVAAHVTTPIKGTKYLGINFGLSYQNGNFANTVRNGTSRVKIDGVNKTANIDTDLFLRDSNIGGVLVGYNFVRTSHNSDYIYTDPIFGNSSGSNSNIDNMSNLTIRGEYYFNNITAALSYNHDHQPLMNSNMYKADSKIYWSDDTVINISAARQNKSSESSDIVNKNASIYSLGFESRPKFLSKALRIGANYILTEGSRNSSNYFAVYSFDNAMIFHTQPSLGIAYSTENGYSDTVSINLGFDLESNISLKDRDRKYIFQK
ncbi:MAG TPA: hypothetical protein VIO56_02465 [Methylotenera sp.]|jgi:hypothetical protein